MSGLYSRRKGMRVEYEVRDLFRSWGYESHRVPASGASQGFKADVLVKAVQKDFLIEVKARHNEFKKLYEYCPMSETDPLLLELDSGFFLVTYTNPLSYKSFIKRRNLEQEKVISRICNKYFKNCDILVVKDDRKPPIFIRRISEPIFKENTLSERNT